jgi:predicted DsbA family dithiol-disulfide isomerase
MITAHAISKGDTMLVNNNPYTLREMAFRVSTADGKMLFSCADAWEAEREENRIIFEDSTEVVRSLRKRLEAAAEAVVLLYDDIGDDLPHSLLATVAACRAALAAGESGTLDELLSRVTPENLHGELP